MEAVVGLERESELTSLCTVVKARKVQVAANYENYRGPNLLGSGGGREGRAKVRSWVGADKWGAAGRGVSRGRRERALPRQARLAREQT